MPSIRQSLFRHTLHRRGAPLGLAVCAQFGMYVVVLQLVVLVLQIVALYVKLFVRIIWNLEDGEGARQRKKQFSSDDRVILLLESDLT